MFELLVLVLEATIVESRTGPCCWLDCGLGFELLLFVLVLLFWLTS